MKTKQESKEILNLLIKAYPDATCSLDFKTPFQIVIAVMLSAQCTDERVNKTTPILFKNYGTPEKLAKIDPIELEQIIHPCGFYKNKAKNAIACSKMLVEKYRWNSSTNHGRTYTAARYWKKKCQCYYARSI